MSHDRSILSPRVFVFAQVMQTSSDAAEKRLEGYEGSVQKQAGCTDFLCTFIFSGTTKIHPFKLSVISKTILTQSLPSPHLLFCRSSSDWWNIPPSKSWESEVQTSAAPDSRGQTVQLKPANFLLRGGRRTDGWMDGRPRLLWVFLWQCLSWLLWGVRTKQSASILPQKFFAIRSPGINDHQEMQRGTQIFTAEKTPKQTRREPD